MLLDQFSGKEEYHRVDEGEQRNDQRPCVLLVTVLVTLMGVKHKVSLIRLNFPSRGKTSNKVAMEVTKQVTYGPIVANVRGLHKDDEGSDRDSE